MNEVLQYALLGLGAGAVYVLLGQGVVLIFRGSGVLNLAQGAFAMLAAYAFNDLRADRGWPSWQAMLVVIAGVALLGLLTDVLVMRSLRRASPLSRLIATLGIVIAAMTVAVLKWGASPQLVTPIFTPKRIDIAGAAVSSDRLWMLAIAVVLTLLLAAVWRFTRMGWIAEAVSEDERTAAALGWSPQFVSATTWTSGAALAAVAGVFISPITQLDITALTFLIVPTLAATLVGGMRSFELTFVGGIGIGVAQSLSGRYIDITGIQDALPFFLIVIILTVSGSSLPLRGHVLDRMPSVGTGRIDVRYAGPAIAAVALGLALLSSDAWQAALTTTFAIAIILLSLVVLIGYAGQVSLAQYALAGIGALVAARLVAAHGWPFPLAVVAGSVAAMLVGVIFALPALRTRGVNLAVVTLGLGLAVQAMVFSNGKYTGGISGTTVGSQSLFGLSIDPIAHPTRYSFVVFACFVAACLLVANVRRSASGRRLLAVRANERAAAASGINVFATKFYAFAISGALAGLGGVLLGFQSTTVTFTTGWDPFASINAVALVVISGVGFVLGAPHGALISPQSLSSLIQNESVQRYLPLIGGVGVLTMLDLQPQRCGSRARGAVAAAGGPAAPAGGRPVAPPDRRIRHPRAVPHADRREPERGYGGVVAVDELSLTVRPGRSSHSSGPTERARPRRSTHSPDSHRHRARSAWTTSTSPDFRPTPARPPASPARGRASSCSTT